MHERLLLFFSGVLKNDSSVKSMIASGGNDIFIDRSNNNLVFSISGLHSLLGIDQKVDYKTFKQLLYQSSLNKDLSDFGGRIDVYHSTSKVDTSLYQLTRIELG